MNNEVKETKVSEVNETAITTNEESKMKDNKNTNCENVKVGNTKTKTKGKATKKRKTTKKVVVKEPSTKPMERVLLKKDKNYPDTKTEQVRCDNLAYMMKEIILKTNGKIKFRNFRVNGQFYGERYFKNYIPKTNVKNSIDKLVADMDLGGMI